MTFRQWLAALAGLCLVAPGLAAAAVVPVYSTAPEACHVLQASGTKLFTVSGYAGQAEFVMVFNSPTVPTDGAVQPVAWGYAGSAGFWSLNWPEGVFLNTGATVCYSSTGPFAKTAISTNNTFTGLVQP